MHLKDELGYNQLFTAIVVVMAADLPDPSLVSLQARCYRASPSWPGSNMVILSECVTIIVHTLVTRGLKITCHNLTAVMWMCKKCEAPACNRQGLCFLWLPVSCRLFSTSPWLSRHMFVCSRRRTRSSVRAIYGLWETLMLLTAS